MRKVSTILVLGLGLMLLSSPLGFAANNKISIGGGGGGSGGGGGGGGGGCGTGTETEQRINLTAGTVYPSAKGRAEYETETKTKTTAGVTTTTTSSSFSVGVNKTGLAVGAVLTVSVGGTSVGTATVSKNGAKLRLSTKHGDTVPTVATGTAISITDPSGAVVASGSF